MILLLLLTVAIAQTPNCTWQCDDPVCPAMCRPICLPPACAYTNCSFGSATPACRVTCEEDGGNAVDACPVCETQCNPPPAPCVIQCEMTQCSWECNKPMFCPKPTCELQCELPACLPSGASIASAAWGTLLLLGIILFAE